MIPTHTTNTLFRLSPEPKVRRSNTIIGPGDCPISRDELTDWMRLPTGQDERILNALISASCAMVEGYMGFGLSLGRWVQRSIVHKGRLEFARKPVETIDTKRSVGIIDPTVNANLLVKSENRLIIVDETGKLHIRFESDDRVISESDTSDSKIKYIPLSEFSSLDWYKERANFNSPFQNIDVKESNPVPKINGVAQRTFRGGHKVLTAVTGRPNRIPTDMYSWDAWYLWVRGYDILVDYWGGWYHHELIPGPVRMAVLELASYGYRFPAEFTAALENSGVQELLRHWLPPKPLEDY